MEEPANAFKMQFQEVTSSVVTMPAVSLQKRITLEGGRGERNRQPQLVFGAEVGWGGSYE